jgi:NDP-sugar pyrophosphorylase family protein
MFEDYFSEIFPGHVQLFQDCDELWTPLQRLPNYCQNYFPWINNAKLLGSVYIEGNVVIGEGTVIEHGAAIIGPVIIGRNCHIRAGAYIRGQSVIGDNAVIGHCTEVVRSIVMTGSRLDHFNYIGDSILGKNSHFGAGAKVANVRFDCGEILVGKINSRKNKFGVILGDNCQIGVNATIGPGVVCMANVWYLGKERLKAGIYRQNERRPELV